MSDPAEAITETAKRLDAGDVLPFAVLRATLLDADGIAPGEIAAVVLVAPAHVGAPDDPDGLARLAAWLRGTAARIDALDT